MVGKSTIVVRAQEMKIKLQVHEAPHKFEHERLTTLRDIDIFDTCPKLIPVLYDLKVFCSLDNEV